MTTTILEKQNFLFKTMTAKPCSNYVRRFGRIIMLHPLWWAIGIDQWVFPISVYLAFVFLLISHRLRFRDFLFSSAVLAYVFCHFLAFFSALDSSNLSHYMPLYLYRTFLFVSAPVLCLILNSVVESSEDILYLLRAIVIAVVWSGIFSVAVFIAWQSGIQSIPTVMGLIVPSSLQSKANILYSVFYKNMIRSTYFFSMAVPRTRGLFMYANLLAFIAEMAVLISIYVAWRTKRAKYLFFSLIAFGLILGTISRTSVLVLLGGTTVAAFLLWKKTRVFILLASFVLAVLLLLDFGGVMGSFSPTQTFTEASTSINEIREDSTRGRMMIYEETWRFIKEKPVLGWGTYQAVPGRSHWAYLGSHSTYLSTLFRFGIFGMVLFSLVIFMTLKRYARASRPSRDFKSPLAGVGFACIVMALVHMFVLDIHDDIFTLNIFWIIISISSILCRLHNSEDGIYL